MFIKELWRYPVKSMAGEQLNASEVGKLGVAGDRKVLVLGPNGRVITSRTHPKLLGLKGTLGADGEARISGYGWNTPEALALVRAAAGPAAEIHFYEGPGRFDVLPLLFAFCIYSQPLVLHFYYRRSCRCLGRISPVLHAALTTAMYAGFAF